ncbi:MAG: aminopeptidase P family protein [Lachnospiraceae bacterium]|nr:aminopeptidase P family protein [Lachnospiraceae bacterium]
MENTVIKERIVKLRDAMKQHGIDYYLITTADYHCSEYVSDFFKCREYFCGFTGSNGNLLVSQKDAGLWTDGRYFVQAEKELEGTGVTLFRMGDEGVPTIAEFLQKELQEGMVLGFDGRCVDTSYGLILEKALKKKKIRFDYLADLSSGIWTDRPQMPSHPLWLLDEAKCGRSVEEKLELIREKMKEQEASYLVLSKLDDLMWLLNIRGGDVECNPVAMSYGVIGLDSMLFFVQESEVTDEARAFLTQKKVTIKPYEEMTDFIRDCDWKGQRVMIDPENISYLLMKQISAKTETVHAENPTEWYKAVKTEAELAQIRDVYAEDSAAVCKFIYWVKQNIGNIPMSELSAQEKMDSLRREISDYVDLSFTTISAYGPNAAMMHYEATPESYSELKPEGFLLVDSGGQYLRGTTDVTRTIALGKISDEMKLHYSKTAAGMLQLAAGKFLYGCGGRNVDILAREPLWELGIDYKCGTGHGIGYILNVHEGPHNIRWKAGAHNPDAVLEAGMIVSDEPGVYIAGSHGIRIENILEVRKDVHNGDGQFMSFGMLTYAPLEREALDKQYLTEKDIERINAYHAATYEKVKKYLNAEEAAWLYEVTRPL